MKNRAAKQYDQLGYMYTGWSMAGGQGESGEALRSHSAPLQVPVDHLADVACLYTRPESST